MTRRKRKQQRVYEFLDNDALDYDERVRVHRRKQASAPNAKSQVPPHQQPVRDQGYCRCRYGHKGHKDRVNAHRYRPRWSYNWYRGPLDVRKRARGHERTCPAWKPPIVEPLPKPKKRREKRGQSKPGRR